MLLPDPDDPLLSAQDVAALLGVHVRTIRRWANTGDIGSLRVGRLLYLKRSDVDTFLDRRRVVAVAR